MDQSLEVPNVKTESTSSDRLEISFKMQVESLKQESECLVQSEKNIKTEPQEVENEFPIIAGTSYKTCYYDNVKFVTIEPLIKMEHKDVVDEIMQNPQDVGSEIKDEKHFPIDLNEGESRIKTKTTVRGKDENFSEPNKDYIHGSASNQDQDHLLIKDDADCKNKKYICNECNKTFRWKSHLVDHVRIHTGEKPFSCDVCKKSFNQKSHFNQHMLIHSDEKPHICDVCQKAFQQKSALHSHKSIHIGVKQFSCTECNKSFVRKHDLVRHKQRHLAEKPFACDICKKTLTQKKSLIEHRRTHTGEKPYSCDICNKSFTQKSTLYTHKKIHKNS